MISISNGFNLGQLYGLEKFWAFLKYYRHSSKLVVDADLSAKLGNYKTITDFRIDVSTNFNISEVNQSIIEKIIRRIVF